MDKSCKERGTCEKCADLQGITVVDTFECSGVDVCCENYLDVSIRLELLMLKELVTRVNEKIRVNEEVIERKRRENFMIRQTIQDFMDFQEEKKNQESSCSCIGKCIVS